ncbi:MAG: hypothetical protein CM1200mP29_05220 [Verrucomicrobiota bacterium]|nr:MAG: hypothetical protein CM1200mP29_05220 [Verrucomicrobiota bacterium]
MRRWQIVVLRPRRDQAVGKNLCRHAGRDRRWQLGQFRRNRQFVGRELPRSISSRRIVWLAIDSGSATCAMAPARLVLARRMSSDERTPCSNRARICARVVSCVETANLARRACCRASMASIQALATCPASEWRAPANSAAWPSALARAARLPARTRPQRSSSHWAPRVKLWRSLRKESGSRGTLPRTAPCLVGWPTSRR